MKKAKQVKSPPNKSKGAKPVKVWILVADNGYVYRGHLSSRRKFLMDEAVTIYMKPWKKLNLRCVRIEIKLPTPKPTRRARG